MKANQPTVYITVARRTMRSWMPDDFPLMVVASSWYRRGKLTRPGYDVTNTPRACDCGGFLAHKRWGGFPYSIEQLADWALSWGADWCATPDWPCEPELTAGDVADRIQRTVEAAAHAIQSRPDVRWFPVLQGWDVDDYHYCYDLYDNIGIVPRAIGTLCRRGKLDQIQHIVSEIGLRHPNRRYHLFGVKLAALGRSVITRYAASIDTAAWSILPNPPDNRRQVTATIACEHGFPSRQAFEFGHLLPQYREKCKKRLDQSKQPALL